MKQVFGGKSEGQRRPGLGKNFERKGGLAVYRFRR